MIVAITEELEQDRRRGRMILELIVAGQQWRASDGRWDPVLALRRCGLESEVGKPLDARAIDYLAEITAQLGPLATTSAALHWAGLVGIEPWLVLGLLRREGLRVPGAATLAVPWEVIRRVNRWSLALCTFAFLASDTESRVGVEPLPARFALDWPLLWHLRELLPHPLSLDPETGQELVAACAALESAVPENALFLEAIWQELWGVEQVMELALKQGRPRRRAPLREEGAGRLDTYPRDDLAEAILTAAGLWVLDPERFADEMAERMAASLGGAGEVLPPVFRLNVSDGDERWHRLGALLQPLVATPYAELCRRVLAAPPFGERRAIGGDFGRSARSVLLEAVLREVYGVVNALVVDPGAALERTRPRAEELLGPLDQPLDA
ncbi:MAG: hypothetical protein RMK01_06965 [Thermomicrobium sp.]|nr:hypothetical protein [Thermomicrobium sp.]